MRTFFYSVNDEGFYRFRAGITGMHDTSGDKIDGLVITQDCNRYFVRNRKNDGVDRLNNSHKKEFLQGMLRKREQKKGIVLNDFFNTPWQIFNFENICAGIVQI
jgi:hypothetical protein